jgi:hypothetical protein
MSESTPEAPPVEPPAAQPQPDTPPPAPDAPPVDDTDWKAEARKWEQRAKANSAAAKEQERQRLASMTESERKEAEAELRGWTSAVEALGERLVRSQFLAAAAKRNADHDTEPLLEDLNLKKYIGDDGEPDAKAIAKAVERLVPAPPSGPPSFDGGARKSAPGTPDMNQLLRAAAGRE